MRLRLLAPLVVVLLAAGPAPAADPPVVFQTQPVGRILNDARAVVGTVVGEKAVESVNAAIKEKLGEKGFAGLDLGRPVLGYVDLPADPAKAVGVLVVPVTEEKAFLGFFERLTGVAPKAGAGGLYTVPVDDPGLTVGLRFADGHAYLAAGSKDDGADPAAVLAKDRIVPAAKLYDPADPSVLAVRVLFDRLPPELRGRAKNLLAEAKKATGLIPFPDEVAGPAGRAVEQGLKLAERYLKLSEGAKAAAVRVTLDAAAAELGAELTVVPLPGSELGKQIAARTPTTNRFAGILTPDTASVQVIRLPLFNDELRTAATEGLDAALKGTAGIGGSTGDLVQELLKGAIRTVKTGEVDVAGAVRGPDKNGKFTAVGVVAFEDPAAVEKAVKAVLDNDAPPEIRRAVKWNAAKAAGLAVHVLDFGKLPQDGGGRLFLGPDLKVFGGADAQAALVFAPKAVYYAIGPDAVGAVKGLLALRPGDAPVVDVTLNPARIIKFMTASGAQPREVNEIAKMLGTDDRSIRLGSLAVTGGGELKVTGRVNLRLIIGWFGANAAATFEPVAPLPPDARLRR
ncbi:MAG TPA: hypothetical protein VH092_34595 [Urbifossiella sp.]|jgi:hypothetical protein|nr:hypothetical protein [Urbifossiella sp.]